jgi:hypothetical protein
VSELAACAGGAGDRVSVYDQDAADADLDDEVEHGAVPGAGAAAGLGDSGEGGVVADQERQRGAAAQRREVDAAPAQGRCLHEVLVLHGAGDGDRDDPHPPAVSGAHRRDRAAQRLEHRAGIAAAVAAGGDVLESAVEAGDGHAPVLVAQVDRERERAARMRAQDGGGAATAGHRRRRLVEQGQLAQPGGDLGGRAARQAGAAGQLGAGDAGLAAQEAERVERAAPAQVAPPVDRAARRAAGRVAGLHRRGH